MKKDFLQIAINERDIDKFKKEWEKISDNPDFLEKNKDNQRFQFLVEQYLNK